jgi:hypothetical protein
MSNILLLVGVGAGVGSILNFKCDPAFTHTFAVAPHSHILSAVVSELQIFHIGLCYIPF